MLCTRRCGGGSIVDCVTGLSELFETVTHLHHSVLDSELCMHGLSFSSLPSPQASAFNAIFGLFPGTATLFCTIFHYLADRMIFEKGRITYDTALLDGPQLFAVCFLVTPIYTDITHATSIVQLCSSMCVDRRMQRFEIIHYQPLQTVL